MINKPGTRVEFYRKGHRHYLAGLSNVGHIPRTGDIVNIAKKNYKVVEMTWCVDHLNEIGQTELRANVYVVRTE